MRKRQRATGQTCARATRRKDDPLAMQEFHHRGGLFSCCRENYGAGTILVLRQTVALIDKQFVWLRKDSGVAENFAKLCDYFFHF